MRYFFSLLFLACSVLSGIAAGGIPAISSLKQGDEIRIEFKSHGCFHALTNDLAIRREKNFKIVWLKRNSTTLENGPRNPNRKVDEPKKELSLTTDEVAGLDHLLDYYRHPDRSFYSTTTHEITFSQVHAGKITAVETFKDQSGGAVFQPFLGGQPRPDITTIDGLLLRLEKL